MSMNLVALDGGGIRGYMSAKILMALEEEAGVSLIDEKTVNGFCGTSTGGLLAIAFATNTSPAQMAQLYKEKSQQIFSPNTSSTFASICKAMSFMFPGFRRLHQGVGVFNARYTASGLEGVARELVQDKTFGDIPTDRLLAITTASLEVPGSDHGWRATTLSNHQLHGLKLGVHDNALNDTRDVSLLDGALSTAAAPGFFPPHLVKKGRQPLGYFADGGTFANNPVMNGFQIATGPMGHKIRDLSVLSIGTGVNKTGMPQDVAGKNPSDFGILHWFGLQHGVPPAALLDMALSCSADNMTSIANSVLGDRVVRLDPKLDVNIPIDGIQATDFANMDQAVQKLRDTDDFEKAVTLVKSWAPSEPDTV